MTTSHSPADDGRKNSSESSCYAYIYCYFYAFTQLYKSLKYRVRIIQFMMRAKITTIDMCAAFSLRRATFLRKCSINRKLDAIEKNGQRIRNQHPKIS